jgi:AMP nucleosidase
LANTFVTNFSNYVRLFAEWNSVEIVVLTGHAMCHSKRHYHINFGWEVQRGNCYDLLSPLNPRLCCFWEIWWIEKRNKLGIFFCHCRAIEVKVLLVTTSCRVRRLPHFHYKSMSTTIRDNGYDTGRALIHHQRRVWEHDDDLKNISRIELMPSTWNATIFMVGFATNSYGALLLISDQPMFEGVKTKTAT